MSEPVTSIRSDLAAVVRAIALDAQRRVALEVVVARGVERLLPLFESDEFPTERIRRENASALREMAALGDTRDAAMKVARRRSSDPHRQEMLAQRYRRLRRSQK
jgi:hypothetical protein